MQLIFALCVTRPLVLQAVHLQPALHHHVALLHKYVEADAIRWWPCL
jgi:hypothetical protein